MEISQEQNHEDKEKDQSNPKKQTKVVKITTEKINMFMRMRILSEGITVKEKKS